MGNLSVPTRSLARSSPDAVPDSTRRPSSPPLRPKPFWTSDIFLAGAGLALLLIGFAAKSNDPWVLWIGVPTAAGLVLYLCLPSLRKRHRAASRQELRATLMEDWEQVVDQLSHGASHRYDLLKHRVSRLGDLFPPSVQQGTLLRPGEYMLWLYLKLLLARDHLDESVRSSHEDQIIAQRQALLEELDSSHLTPSTRQSKQETVLILDQRVLTLRNRAGRIEEIESDLTRVEQWVALMHDQAAQHNTLGDAGRRVHFAAESLTLPSLEGLPGAALQELDARITSLAFS
jgi:hypothetical protein